MSDPALFAPHFPRPSWDAWHAVAKALDGLGAEMTEEEAALFRRCTGRTALPTSSTNEATLRIGRRGGKSRFAGAIAVHRACFFDYSPHLAAGEVATVAVIAADRKQARNIFRYVVGLLRAVPMLADMIDDETAEAITLNNRVVIEVATASWRVTRGYTFVCVVCDEVAFWRDESSANPADEIIRAIRPGLSSIPGALLVKASSPHAKRGPLYADQRRYYGQDDARVLVWGADTASMNPRIDPRIIAEAYEEDPQAAAAEYGAEFRDDLADFVTREVVEACVAPGRYELPPVHSVHYVAFCDPSGGSNDAMTLAIAHREGGRAVLDLVREVPAPFSPDAVVQDFAETLKAYNLRRVEGDRYAGQWPAERFKAHGITYQPAAQPKSELYLALLPALNSGSVELLDLPRLRTQLVSLERRTARGGRDSVDHPPGAKDDVANAAAGALLAAGGGLSESQKFAAATAGMERLLTMLGNPNWRYP